LEGGSVVEKHRQTESEREYLSMMGDAKPLKALVRRAPI
jgi:hypothetical protein